MGKMMDAMIAGMAVFWLLAIIVLVLLAAALI